MRKVVTHFPGHGTLFEETYLEGKAEGEARGEAKGVLRVLEVRGLAISEDVRERISISTCTDLDRVTTTGSTAPAWSSARRTCSCRARRRVSVRRPLREVRPSPRL